MEPRFFALIIGSEILNGRREDKHLKFLIETLNKRGLKFSGSFIIEDDPNLIASTIGYIASIPNSILLSFGGIGSTPDDYTREAASKALGDGKLYIHPQFEKIIKERTKNNPNPHAINMAKLPKGASLIPNPINKMPGFYLEDRFFFMPGFPEMSHPMVEYILDKFFKDKGKKIYRYTLTAHTRESEFIDLMKEASPKLEVSSLPKLYSDGFRATLSVASEDKEEALNFFNRAKEYLDKKGIIYSIGEE